MNKKKKYNTPEDEEFARTGSFSMSFSFSKTITQGDMERELVKEVEGQTLPAKDLDGHNQN